MEEARAAGIKPVLCTPLTRRYFEADGKVHSDLLEYSASDDAKVAAEMKVPLIDLQAESIAYLDKVGETEGNTLAITKKDDDGKTIFDKTHLDWEGSYVFGRMVAVDVGQAAPAMAKYVMAKAAELASGGREGDEDHQWRAGEDCAGGGFDGGDGRRLGAGVLRGDDAECDVRGSWR